MKPRPEDASDGPPCPGCLGPHDLRACSDMFDLVAFFDAKVAWSRATFGPGHRRGFLVHSALAIAPDGTTLGLVLQHWTARDDARRGDHHQRPLADKESAIWGDATHAVEGWAAVDGDGLTVTPGFIDVHTHDDATVLHDLLDRLESSALFSEESCSFSQRDLLDNLQTWIDKARGQLTPAGS